MLCEEARQEWRASYRITGFAKDADDQVNFVKDQRY